MTNKELVIHLIREELRNKRLMHSLEDLGFDCSFYTLNISQAILDIVGFHEKPDELYEWYFELINRTLEGITFWNLDEMLNKRPLNVYIELLEKKLNQKVLNKKNNDDVGGVLS
jgi:hypothetical protein